MMPPETSEGASVVQRPAFPFPKRVVLCGTSLARRSIAGKYAYLFGVGSLASFASASLRPSAAQASPQSSSAPPPPPPGRPPQGTYGEEPKTGLFSALGWAIPIIGLPALGAWYNYQQEYNKEWDTRIALELREALAKRLGPKAKPQPAPGGAPLAAAAAAPPAAPTLAATPATAAASPPPSALERDLSDAANTHSSPSGAPAAALDLTQHLVEERAQAAAAGTSGGDSVAAAAGAVLHATASFDVDSVLHAAAAASAADAAVAAASEPSAAAGATDDSTFSVTPGVAALLHDATDGMMVSLSPVPQTHAAPSSSAFAAAAPMSAAPAAAEEGVSDSAGASPSTQSTDSMSQQQQQQHTASVSPAAVEAAVALLSDAAGSGEGVVPEGLAAALSDMDISAAAMVRIAMQALGPDLSAANNWTTFPARHHQAQHDSALLGEVLHKVHQWHSAEMDKARGEVAEAQARLSEEQSMSEAVIGRLKSLLRLQAASAQEAMDMEVRQAEKRGSLAAQRVALQDAMQRMQQLQEVRTLLGALQEAHRVRVDMAATARSCQALSVGTAALAAASDAGVAPVRALSVLRPLAQADPLVGAVTETLPRPPTPPRAMLAKQLAALRADLSALSFFPGASGGLVAHALARLVGYLKVDESKAVQSLGVKDGGVDAILAQVELLVVKGEYGGAAELLERHLQGTAAAALAADWVAQAKQRASLDAAVMALNAHAAAVAASLT